MRSKHSFIITAIFTILAFCSVTYVSCTKPDNTDLADQQCINVNCQNGGYCVSGTCYCPQGFEGKSCETKWADRYVGTWDMYEKVTSSTAPFDTATLYYRMEIKPTSSNVKLTINDFLKNAYADGITVQINRIDSFTFNTNQLIPDTKKFIKKGSGIINSYGTVIRGDYVREYTRDSVTLTTETVRFVADRVQ